MPFCNGTDWFIQIPLSELVALQGLPAKMEELRKDNEQLRREVKALHALYSQTLQALSDYKRDTRKS